MTGLLCQPWTRHTTAIAVRRIDKHWSALMQAWSWSQTSDTCKLALDTFVSITHSFHASPSPIFFFFFFYFFFPCRTPHSCTSTSASTTTLPVGSSPLNGRTIFDTTYLVGKRERASCFFYLNKIPGFGKSGCAEINDSTCFNRSAIAARKRGVSSSLLHPAQ